MTQLESVSRPIRLKRSDHTFVGTRFRASENVCHIRRFLDCFMRVMPRRVDGTFVG